jgi:hypothetical protein
MLATLAAAFDKGDLLYLRDEEEKRRFQEQELRESELRSFARMRQKTEALQNEQYDPDLGTKKDDGRCGTIYQHHIGWAMDLAICKDDGGKVIS